MNSKSRDYFGTLAIMTRILFTNMFTAIASKMTPKNLCKNY